MHTSDPPGGSGQDWMRQRYRQANTSLWTLMLMSSELDANILKSLFLNRFITCIFVSRCVGGLCAVTPWLLETKCCLRHRHFLKLQTGHRMPPARFDRVHLFPRWGCRSPQELTVTKCALTAANELRCPHHLNQKCWKPGTPLGSLPTQTCSCSPTPAAFFALCKPLLCLQSVV